MLTIIGSCEIEQQHKHGQGREDGDNRRQDIMSFHTWRASDNWINPAPSLPGRLCAGTARRQAGH
jgi:hypothetical protein